MNLKSSLDRFIEEDEETEEDTENSFKIQFGQIYRVNATAFAIVFAEFKIQFGQIYSGPPL